MDGQNLPKSQNGPYGHIFISQKLRTNTFGKKSKNHILATKQWPQIGPSET